MPSSASPDLTLTPTERARFDDAVGAAAQNSTAVSGNRLTAEAAWENQLTVSASGSFPDGSVIQVEVASAAALNAAVGVSPAIFAQPGVSAMSFAPPALARAASAEFTASEVTRSLDRGEHLLLKRSLDSLVFSDPAQAAANAELVNAVLFPMTLNVVAAQSLTLNDGVTLQLNSGYYLIIVGSLSIGSQASIQSTVTTVINAQVAYSAND